MARVHLRPLLSNIVVPLDTIAQRSDAELRDRARQQIRALVNNLQIGGGLDEVKAWEATTAAFLDELAGRLALETDGQIGIAIVWLCSELRMRIHSARDAVAA